MNPHALRVLEYREALELVAGFAAGPLGGMAVRALEPSTDAAWIDGELRRVDQMTNYILREGDAPAPRVPDIRPSLRKLGVEGSVLDAPALKEIADVATAARETRTAIAPRSDAYPLLAEVAQRLADLQAAERVVRKAVDEAGDLRDDASRDLLRLRRDIRATRGRIVDELERYVSTLPERARVPDASVTVREGRYVIPVRREARSEVGGIVHDESATGHTLYVEPPVAIELMNRLREIELAEAREVLRILRELTDRLRPHRDELETTLAALVELDSLGARARYSLQYNGRRPELSPDGQAYHIVEGRHPLLLATAERVVPFDIALDPTERTLLVSGPNTGGKTVLLKAMGLISALAQAGVVPPVGMGTRLPVFDDIFADIGDEQSIEASLSTFSAHLRNLREIVENADEGSLALIDEIGSGTDPLEGAALARAILIELTRRGARTVATTHLGELKRLASTESGVVNASLQFDARELRPTYRLMKGVPGRSYGLAIARRLGMPESVIERAESFVPDAERAAERLLAELEEKDRRLAEALDEAESAGAAATALRTELEARETAWRRRQRELEREAREEARRILLGAREEVNAVIEELRSRAAALETGSAAELEAAASRARRRIEEAAKREVEKLADVAESPAPTPTQAIEVGAHVRIEATGALGRVSEIRDGRATVETEGLRLVVPVGGLAVVPEARASAARPRQGGWTAPEVDASPEVDLRGLRADEVAGVLEPALDAALRGGLSTLRIIHGKGTGALREVVAEMLRVDPRVGGFRLGGPGEGGSGVTIAELA